MIKKLLVAGTVVAVGMALVFGKDAFSYVWMSAKRVRAEAKGNVPLDFEIERARAMVADLIPDIRKSLHTIAEEEVAVADLREEITGAEKNLDSERGKLLTLRSDLDNRDGKFYYAGRKASAQEVRAELGRRFDRFQTAEATVSAKRQMLEAREKCLTAARSKLAGMLASKRDLEIQVQNLEARLSLLQAAQTTSPFQFDDNQLSRCKKLVQELRKRLDVGEEMIAGQDGKLGGDLSMEPQTTDDIAEKIDHYFGAKPGVEPTL